MFELGRRLNRNLDQDSLISVNICCLWERRNIHERMSIRSILRIMEAIQMRILLFSRRIIIFRFQIKHLMELWIDLHSFSFVQLSIRIQQIEKWMQLTLSTKRIFNLIFGDFTSSQNLLLTQILSSMVSAQVIDLL